MNGILLGVVVAALLVAAVARRFGLSSPLILVLVGLIACQIPGVPELELDPDLVLFVVLPPLLYSAALDSSYLALRSNLRPIGFLAVGLPLATTAAVGFVAYLIVPEFSIAAALVLGAIVAPPDAVSASAIGRKLGLPRRIMTLLGGESLLNDATALTAYKVALAAAVGTGATLIGGFETFLVAAVGGTVIGLAVGFVISKVRGKLQDPVMESGIGLVVPFFTYLAAEEVHASGVIAVVVAGLFLGQRSTRASYATRLQDTAVWRAVDLILESFVFLLIGLQLAQCRQRIAGVQHFDRRLGVGCRSRDRRGGPNRLGVPVHVRTALAVAAYSSEGAGDFGAGGFVVSWAGMRGVVSLAAAFAIPLTVNSGEDFPGRSLILFLTFVVVVGTLLLHGLTLPWVIRVLGVQGDEEQSDARAEAAAQDKAARAAAARLDELVGADADDVPQVRNRAADILRSWNTHRANSAWERLGRSDEDLGESPSNAFRSLRLEMIDAERGVFIAERDAGRIDDEVLRKVLRELDLEEATLDRD